MRVERRAAANTQNNDSCSVRVYRCGHNTRAVEYRCGHDTLELTEPGYAGKPRNLVRPRERPTWSRLHSGQPGGEDHFLH